MQLWFWCSFIRAHYLFPDFLNIVWFSLCAGGRNAIWSGCMSANMQIAQPRSMTWSGCGSMDMKIVQPPAVANQWLPGGFARQSRLRCGLPLTYQFESSLDMATVSVTCVVFHSDGPRNINIKVMWITFLLFTNQHKEKSIVVALHVPKTPSFRWTPSLLRCLGIILGSLRLCLFNYCGFSKSLHSPKPALTVNTLYSYILQCPMLIKEIGVELGLKRISGQTYHTILSFVLLWNQLISSHSPQNPAFPKVTQTCWRGGW